MTGVVPSAPIAFFQSRGRCYSPHGMTNLSSVLIDVLFDGEFCRISSTFFAPQAPSEPN